jgi:ornithine cyclodeaminase
LAGIGHHDAAAVHAALPYPALIEALRQGFARGATAPVRHHHSVPRPGADPAVLLLMPAWFEGGVTGVKLVHICAGNETRGLPSVQGLYVLFDGPTGTPLATLDGTALTLRRTACASALAASCLARPDASALLVVGAGAMAPHLARAHATVRPIRRVQVWNRTPDRARQVADELRASGLDAAAVDDLARAQAEADVISCCTMSRAALVRGDLVRPGTHVDLVGAYTPAMRESDDSLIGRARVYVDTRAGALAEAGDILQPIASGAFAAERIVADLADLAAGRDSGRRSADEVTVFKSVGTAVEDLIAAALVVGRPATPA